MNPASEELRKRILELAREYHGVQWPERPFEPGVTPIAVSQKVFDGDDIASLVDSALDFWLTAGRFADRLEEGLARFVGVRHAMLVNSGSSANLLALTALTSPTLGERRLRPGDEVITVASGFPTTVNPILQNGLVPVFVDVRFPEYDVDPAQLDAALSPRTRALMLAHTLGNPFDLDAVTAFAKAHDLWLVEDCCDALGSTYRGRLAGTFGHVATLSFYPAHHMTLGEGGCVLTDDPALARIVGSLRDWGRDCWCKPGRDNTCGRRFGWQHGTLPFGYDHKYVFSHIGYNLKVTDMQAAVGVSQLAKLPGFIAARRRNFRVLREGMADLADLLVLPDATPGSDPSWFGFPLAVQPGAPFTRNDVVLHLEDRRIATRQLFGGNLLRQPAYRDVPHRTIGELPWTDRATEDVFWIGVHPALTDPMLAYMIATLRDFCAARGAR